jgi:Bacterial Ig-like domain
LTLNGYFTGNVDEIRVWNGRALTSSEVASAYNNGVFNTNGQVAYLSFSSLETTPPTITSKSPDDGATGVTTDTIVVIVFSEDMLSSSVNTKTIQLKKVSTNILLSTTVNEAGGIVNMDPTSNLEDATEYEVRVDGGSSGVKDLAGNPIPREVVWRFTTLAASGDPFGVKKIYPTRSGGEEWYMDMANPLGDPRFGPIPSTITKNPDGSWKISGTQIRLHVFTSTGYDKNKISTYDQQQLASKGYMQASNDWKNVEMTGYVKLNDYDAAAETLKFQWYNRGGKHISERPCEGTGYKGGIYFDGRQRTAKEQWHVSYVFPSFGQQIGSVQGKWIGFKYIVYNTEQSGNMVPKMEQWVDTSNDGNQDGPWTKIYEYVDTGGLGSEGTACNGAPDQLITWGGPDATFRWDNSADTDFKYLSVREIQPP